ncbi:MAG TPA: hypothetical protein VEF06_07300 [Bryobacteraceae bacterium]|nr:hypothetical protein [Bryobacteraceae bacterium]
MAIDRKYERDVDLLLAEEFTVSPPFVRWFLDQTRSFRGLQAEVEDVFTSRSDVTGESDLVVIFRRHDDGSRFAVHIEDKIDAPLQPEQELRYRQRADADVSRGAYATYDVILCSPQGYRESHPDAEGFDAFVTYEQISGFLSDHAPDDRRHRYRAAFLASAAKKSSNTYERIDDARTNLFWAAAYDIAVREFPELEMKPLTVTKDSTWIEFRPKDMPSLPRRIYISFKGDRGFMDLTFSACTAYLFQPRIAALLEPDMTVHQTGKAAAVRIKTDPVLVREVDELARQRLREAFAACVRLIRFYRTNRERLMSAAAESLPEPAATRG